MTFKGKKSVGICEIRVGTLKGKKSVGICENCGKRGLVRKVEPSLMLKKDGMILE